MADRLAALLRHYRLSARVFHSGLLCSSERFHGDGRGGHLHVVKRPPVRLRGPKQRPVRIEVPTLILFPRPLEHELVVEPERGADLVCAAIDLGAARGSPLAQALPARLVVPLDQLPGAASTIELLFLEAFGAQCGRDVALDRLCELLLLQLLRYAIDELHTDAGLLAGLADERLARALSAMHADPRRAFGLADLAFISGMSRARFAAHFHRTLGMPPLHYLARFRLGLACNLLAEKKSVAYVADEVGYGSSTAFSRAFRAQLGATPTEWQAANAERFAARGLAGTLGHITHLSKAVPAQRGRKRRP